MSKKKGASSSRNGRDSNSQRLGVKRFSGQTVTAGTIIVLAAILGVHLDWNPLHLLGVIVVVLLGAAFFCCLSITVAGLAMTRDRMMGIGQAIMMPLFFASNALYPVELMPGWLKVLAHINPLSYQVEALRGLLIGTPARLWLDFGVLVVATALGVTAASGLLARLSLLVLALIVVAPAVCAARTALLAAAFLVEFLSQGHPAVLSALTDLPSRPPGAFIDLLRGANTGKMLVRL